MTVTLLLPRDGARHIAAENAGRSGRFWINHARADGLMVVSAVKTAGARYQVKLEPKHHPLNSAADSGGSWPWFQVAVDLHWGWEATIKRFGAAVSREAFDRYLTQKLKDPGNTEFLVLTYAPEFDEAQYEELHAPPFAAWWVSRDGARGVPVAVEPESTGIDQLRPHWPVADLAGVTVMVVGVGSIGGAAAAALAGYGVGRLRLVDPDRLMWHNLVRHVLPVRHVGRHKVDGLRDHLEQHRPDVSVEALRLDVVDDARPDTRPTH